MPAEVVYAEVEEGALFRFSWSSNRTEEVPNPQEQKDQLRKKATKTLKKLF